MKAKDNPRFDVAALRRFAGDKVFARGEAYVDRGQVEILAIEPGRVLAVVAGGEDYRTEVTGRGAGIGGECSCPAFERGFCKHMVAVALAANAAGGGSGATVDALPRIRAHLKAKGVDALVDMVVGFAERDRALFRKLDLAAAALAGDDKTVEARLRKAIDDATRVRSYVEYHAAPAWAAGVDAALDAVAELAAAGRAGVALALAQRAIDRIATAIESVDDSDGYCGASLARARDIHLAAAGVARPDPVALARLLYRLETEGVGDVFYRAAWVYAEILGAKGQAEYRRLATEAWEKLPARAAGRGAGRHPADDVFEVPHASIDILDAFAERDGDVDLRIALRAKDLSTASNYQALAEFCLSQGRADEALRRAEEGLWMFEDGPPNHRLAMFTADLLAKARRKADAVALLRRAFEKSPNTELYERLRKTGGKEAGAWAIALLRARLVEGGPGRAGRLVDVVVEILKREGMFDAAWEVARAHGASKASVADLARATETTHPRDALAVYAPEVEFFATVGGDSAYAQAVRLLARMETLRSAAEHAEHIASLKLRFARKRNFIKLLE